VAARHAAEKLAPCEQRGYRERDRTSRHIVERGEAAIKDLLLTAQRVQDYHFGWKRVLQIRRRIIEGKVPIRANPEQYDIDGSLSQKRWVGPTCCFRIAPGIDPFEAGQGKVNDEIFLEPVCEASRRILRQSDVLVHVEGRDALPVNARLTAKSGEHLALARRRRKNQAKVTFLA
jgi:hypothetical protein